MQKIDFGELEKMAIKLRKRFPVGSRVRLVKMDGESLPVGTEGTVIDVDDIGTIHVHWDCGSSLGVVYPEDRRELITKNN